MTEAESNVSDERRVLKWPQDAAGGRCTLIEGSTTDQLAHNAAPPMGFLSHRFTSHGHLINKQTKKKDKRTFKSL